MATAQVSPTGSREMDAKEEKNHLAGLEQHVGSHSASGENEKSLQSGPRGPGQGEDYPDNALLDSEFSESMDSSELGCCHPATATHRYFALIFMSLLAFGSYYCYDNPGALTTYIMDDMGVKKWQYDCLYSFYSYPNVILCFFGGYLIDRVFGIRMGAIIFAAIICLGQVVFAFGALVNVFEIMVFGRFLFGVGGESLAVAQNTYAVLWFKGKELNTVFGVQLSIARLGSMANFNSISRVYTYISHYFEGHTCLGITLMLAGVLCLFSLFCALILALLDKRAERILRRQESGTNEVINIKDVAHFPLQFWILCLICVFYYVAIFPFIANAGDYLKNKYNITADEANFITSVPYTVSAIVSPFCGMLCDLTGLNLVWTIVATILSALCHLTFSYAPIDFIPPAVIMGVLGFGFSLLACAFWPMVALVIPEHQLGTAYGVMQAIQNLGMAIVNQTAGVVEESFGPNGMEIYFLLWMLLSIVAGLFLQVQNATSKGVLNPSLWKKNICRRAIDEDEETLVHQD